MRKFVDNNKDIWTLSIDVGAIKRCVKLMGQNPLDLVKEGKTGFLGLLAKLDDIIWCVDVLWCICKPEADTRNLSDEEFAARFDGDILVEARNELAKAFADFFPEGRQREAMLATIAKMSQIQTKLLEKIDPEIEKFKALDPNLLANAAYDSLMNGQAVSESTPATSVSANST
jgi:hypothetical protein